MVTRCITALNELDRVSQKISQKHSQKRFQTNAETKLKLAKKKVAHAFQECDTVCASTSGTPMGSVCAEWNTSAQEREKGAANSPLSSKHQRRDRPKGVRRCSKSAVVSSGTRRHVVSQAESWSNCRLVDSLDRCKTGSTINEKAVSPRPVSIYGHHTEAESKYRPNSWFNFTEETSMGIIDSFACDANNLKAVCYTVDKTQTKGMPKLLRHRMEVRVGQNGVVRKASEVGIAVSQGSPERQGTSLNAKNDKERVAPLSWDEQMNWNNVKCLSQKLSSPKDLQKKGFCETQPVIFHPKERADEELLDDVDETTSTFSNAKFPAYRMYLETRTLCADRRNLITSPEKLITMIGVEDVREDREVPVNADKKIHSDRELEETLDEEKADSSGVAYGVDNDHWSCADIKEMSLNQVAKVTSEKVSKKVSFDDGKREPLEAFKGVEDIAVNTGISSLTRPRSSCERLLTARDFGELPSQRPRPCTAPPSSPRHHHYADAEEVWHELKLLSIDHPAAVKIPTSRLDSTNVENAAEEDEITDAEDEKRHFFEGEDFTENSSEKEPKDCKMPSKLRVTFAPMSAPTRKVSESLEDNNAPNRSKSAMLHTRQKAYSPPSPVVIFSQSSLELPKDLPPAQALLTLRKKIREDLEQQNQDLQLDIQQLHLSRHLEDV